MTRAEPLRIPPADFRTLVRLGVTPSYNVLVRNPQGEYLYVLRKNEPVKDHWWCPGGRLFNGETPETAVRRVMEEEIGLTPADYAIEHLSDRFNSEIYKAEEMDPAEIERRYGPGVAHVHYWASVAVISVTAEAAARVTLDEQSGGMEWRAEIPNDHPYLAWYFQVAREAGF
ncbi:MAG: NUDIX domain-containing protein [Candidatus Peribacteraceae bacterium]|nr:NUDIX domain-containing protein [Candidatus Peribacteraceae bacterium]